MMTFENSGYYVYLLLDPTDFFKPFYVGKGKGDRWKAHFQAASIGENRFKDNKISKIRRSGAEPIAIKWEENLSETEAYDLEESLIKRFGRRIDKSGFLTNICASSRPPLNTGRKVPMTTRQKIGDKQRGELNHRHGKAWSDAEKQKRSVLAKERGWKPPIKTGPMKEETKNKISAANKGRKWSAESRARISQQRTGQKRGSPTPETIEKIRISNIGVKKRPMTDLEKALHAERIRKSWDERRLKFGPSGMKKK